MPVRINRTYLEQDGLAAYQLLLKAIINIAYQVLAGSSQSSD
jgi:hypothetical protein